MKRRLETIKKAIPERYFETWVVISPLAYVALASLMLFWIDRISSANWCSGHSPEAEPMNCFEFWLSRYQPLTAAMIALTAALLAIRPVWRQVIEMRRQSAHVRLDFLKRRSVELEAQRQEIYRVTSSIQNTAEFFATLCMNAIVNRVQPMDLGNLQASINYMDEGIKAAMSASLPLWGDVTTQDLWRKMIDAAQLFSVEINKVQRHLPLGSALTQSQADAYANTLMPHKKGAFEAGEELHAAIAAERTRTGSQIEKLERDLDEEV